MNRHASINRSYRLVWHRALEAYVPASETTRGRRKCGGSASGTGAGRTSLIAAAAAALSLGAAGMTQANPTGGQVTAGNGAISQSSSATTVDQLSQNLSINWQSFSIGSQQSVRFVQPNSASIAINRVVGADASAILGHLDANGQVYLINPNGIIFGKGAQVNVGGLVASALNLNPSTETSDAKNFTDASSGAVPGSVLNQGTITAVRGGSVALLGNKVGNTGTITAQLGTVALGAGSAATLTFNGSRLVSMQIDESVFKSLVENGGLIQADGGRVLMTAGAKNSLLASAVNDTGVIEARTVENHEGSITLLGGMSAGIVSVGGTLDASAPNGGDGGSIETSAAHVEISNVAKITTAAAYGKSGGWLIDPADFTIAPSGGDATGAQISGDLASGNVTIASSAGSTGGSGNVNVDDAVSWSANTLTLNAQNNINIDSPMNASGTAKLALQYGQGAVNANNTSVYNVNAPVNLPAGQNFSTRLGSDGTVTDFTVITGLGAAGSITDTDLQGINGNIAGNYALGSNIDATATSAWNGNAGFTPINTYSGTFDGLGHTISNLTINQPSSVFMGLFATVAGRVQNVGLIAGTVTGSDLTGMLAGMNQGTIYNTYAVGSVTAGNDSGGLVGYNRNGGTIANSYAAVSMSGLAIVGDLVGLANTGTITNSYATGAVSATSDVVGGLVGYAINITLSNSYATGSVSGGFNVGGLTGYNNHSTITDTYATGAVSGSGNVGGLIGVASGGSVTNSYWNTTTSGLTASAGGAGLTTVQMQTASNFSGFTFTATPGTAGNAWVMVDSDGTLNNAGGVLGATFPMLASEYSNSVSNAHQLQLMSMAPTANYTLGANVDASATGLAVANGQNDIWSTPGGFVPVGSSAQSFTGTFDGLGHSVSNLSIDRPGSSDPVGLFSTTRGAVVNNVGLINVAITGNNEVGALMGQTVLGSATHDYATGQVNGNSNVGGLIGYNNTTALTYSYAAVSVTGTTDVGGLMGNTNGGVVSSANYATGNVTGSGNDVGGLVGYNGFAFVIVDSYATGNVVGAANVGGLVGYHYNGVIADSYSSGASTGTSNVGGLVGYTNTGSGGTVNDSFWNSTTSGLASSAGGTALTGALMQQQGNFTSATSANGNVNPAWDFNAFWVMYDSHTSPLLRAFMTPLTVTAVDDAVTYNATAFSGGNGVSYTTTTGDGQVLGTANFSGNSQGAMNHGTYALTPGGLYSDQQGYLLSYASGTLTINQAPLTVSGTTVTGRTYDGTYAANLTGGSLLGAVTGDSVSLIQSGTYASKTPGTSIAVTATDILGGTSADDYLLTEPTGLTGIITAAPLTVTATTVAGKTYNGTSAATLTGGSLVGVIAGDTVNLNQSGNYASKNAGINIAVTATDTLGGASMADYTLTEPTGLTGTITAAPLAVTATTVAGKTYDGTYAANLIGGSLVGAVTGDSVSLIPSGTFTSKTPGTGIAVTATDTLGGTSAGNYLLTEPTGLTGIITAAPLTVAATTVAGKTYDGTSTATLTGGSLVGVIAGDTVSLSQSGHFSTALVGNDIPVTAMDTLSGANAADYTLTEPTGLSGRIESATFTGLGVNAFNTLAELVADTFAPQFFANSQIIAASPGMSAAPTDPNGAEVSSSGAGGLDQTCAAESTTGAGCSGSARHRPIPVITMNVGTSGTLAIEDGGLRLPSPVATKPGGRQ